MAHFNLYLLTSNLQISGKMSYIADLISSFNNKIVEPNDVFHSSYPSTYTYNESVSFHTNGQSELQFTLDKYLLEHDNYTPNPYAQHIHIGSLIWLQDQYERNFLYIVKNITFTLNELNVIYTVTCQDAFSYQLSRQNSGYTIKNDINDIDFIGTRTYDDWIIDFIKPDCRITDTYVRSDEALYLTEDNQITFSADQNNIKKQLKPAYINTASGFEKEQCLFSVSNSSANAALISLAEELGLMLVVYYDVQSIDGQCNINTYFWLAPTKNTDTSGLTYTPKTNIQDFNFSFSGDSLTTVMNIDAVNATSEETITALPKLSPFFTNVINSSEWDTEQYYKGYFTSLLYGKRINQTINNVNIIKDTDYILIPLELFNWPSYYRYIKFNQHYKNEKNEFFIDEYTYVQLGDKILNSNTVNFQLHLKTTDNIIYDIAENTEVTNLNLIQQIKELYLKINQNDLSNIDIPESASVAFTVTLYQPLVEEDYLFAEIADEMPWLENKLIDFSYFVRQKILAADENKTLLSLLNNDLRIINGHLLHWTAVYYQKLQERISTIAKITSQVDQLGSTFYANIIDNYSRYGDITNWGANSNKILNNFNDLYSQVFPISTEQKDLLEWSKIAADVINKGFDAEQRFLKNIYLFDKTFNEKVDTSFNNIYNITFSDINNTHYLLTTNPFKAVETGDEIGDETPLFKKINGEFIPWQFVTSTNKNLFFSPNIRKNDTLIANTDKKIISSRQYYISTEDYKNIFKKTVTNTTDNYVPLSNTELYQLYIYYNTDHLYQRRSDIYIPFDWIRYPWFDNTFFSYFNPFLINFDNNEDFLATYPDDIGILTWTSLYDTYAKHFSLDQLYYFGKKTIIKNNQIEYLNEFNLTADDYKNTPKGSNPDTFQTYQPIHFVNDILGDDEASTFPYFTYQKNTWMTGWLHGVSTFFGISPVGLALGVTSIIQHFQEWGYELTAGNKPDRTVTPSFSEDKTTVSFKLNTYKGYECEKYTALDSYFANYVIDTKAFETIKTAPWINNSQWEPYYSNYYSLIAATYSFEYNPESTGNDHLFIKNKYYRVITNFNEKISSKNKYAIIPVCGPSEKTAAIENIFANKNIITFNQFTDNLKEKNYNIYINPFKTHPHWRKYNDSGSIYFSSIEFYFLKSMKHDLNFINKNAVPLRDALNELYGLDVRDEDTIQFITKNALAFPLIYAKNTGLYGMLVEIEDYDRVFFNTAVENTDIVINQYNEANFFEVNHLTNNLSNIYDTNTNSIIYFNQLDNFFEKITIPVFYLAEEDSNFRPSTEKDTVFYIKYNDNYYLTEEKPEKLDSNIYYYLSNNIVTSAFEEYPSTIYTPLYKYDENNHINLINSNIKWTKTDTNQYTTTVNEEILTITATPTNIVSNISAMSKGKFWSLFHNHENELVLNVIASIETELTEYWSNAANASKYCRYFIPDSWRNIENGIENYWNKHLFITTAATQENQDNGQVNLNYSLIPSVDMLDLINPIGPNAEYDLKYKIVYKDNTLIDTKYKTLYSVVKENPSFASYLEHLFKVPLNAENLANWYAEPAGYTKYYHAATGGLNWSNVLNFLNLSNINFYYLDGLYNMQYYVLTNYYKELKLENYEYYRKEQLNIWQTINKNYPFILLENNYSNELATTSKELFRAAKMAFKDKQYPEKNYNITIINTAELNGYIGQELLIGDNILVESFYDEYDDIYEALNQYLFITDIQYNLRSDGDINLTVNNIKYDDKLIKDLVKLIR